jgi:hypothetical protein
LLFEPAGFVIDLGHCDIELSFHDCAMWWTFLQCRVPGLAKRFNGHPPKIKVAFLGERVCF